MAQWRAAHWACGRGVSARGPSGRGLSARQHLATWHYARIYSPLGRTRLVRTPFGRTRATWLNVAHPIVLETDVRDISVANGRMTFFQLRLRIAPNTKKKFRRLQVQNVNVSA